MKQKNRVVGLTTSDLETYYEATVIKTGWHWHKEDVGQWNKIGSIEIGPYIYGHLSFDRLPRQFSMWKEWSSTNGAEMTGYLPAKKEVGPRLHTMLKVNSKWIKDLNVKR